MFKAIIFGLDGVLVDTHELHNRMLQQALNEDGFMWDDDFTEFSRESTITSLRKLTLLGILDRKNRERIYSRKKNLYCEAVSKVVTERKEILACLEELRATHPKLGFGVCTNMSFSQAHQCLRTAGLYTFFGAHHLVNSSSQNPSSSSPTFSTVAPKPDPEGFHVIAERMLVKTSECIVLENSIDGITAAKSAECGMVMHTTYNTLFGELKTLLGMNSGLFLPCIEKNLSDNRCNKR